MSTTLVEEKTSLVHVSSLYRRKVMVPVGRLANTRLPTSRTGMPTTPPGDAVAKMAGARFRTVMVKVWQAGVDTPLLAQTVVGPKVPAIVGTPARLPDGASSSPGGSSPEVTAKEAGGVCGVEANWCR
jgi:hypothetical protein